MPEICGLGRGDGNANPGEAWIDGGMPLMFIVVGVGKSLFEKWEPEN